jgi:phenylpyruvate tautomerase PptA (4-oxalocrotonate tautomerase family)
MPVVETTILEGYDTATKTRLLKAMTRAVRSVVAAPLDGIVTVLREVGPSAYARGGIPRVPGPPLPPATDIAKQFALALQRGDLERAQQLAAEGFTATSRDGRSRSLSDLVADEAKRKKQYQRFDESLTDNGTLVFARGNVSDSASQHFVDCFHVVGATVAEHISWG